MSKYQEYDKELLRLIGEGHNTFIQLMCDMRVQNGAEGWRVTDRRLQALRKSGKIAYSKHLKTWGLVS